MSIIFPNENKTTGGKDGADLTLLNAQQQTTYTALDWSFVYNDPDDWFSELSGYWAIDEGTSFPYLESWKDNPVPPTTTFPYASKVTGGKDGAEVTSLNAKKQTTYENLTWDFVSDWDIDEDVSFPYIYDYPLVTLGALKRYNIATSSWEPINLKKYNPNTLQYTIAKLKYWDGTQWKLAAGHNQPILLPNYYTEGDENIPVTGGWVPGYFTGTGAVSKEADHLYLYTSTNTSQRAYVTDSLIDLTDINTLYTDWQHGGSNTTSSRGIVLITTDKVTSIYESEKIIASGGGNSNWDRHVQTLDVSTATGLCHIQVTAFVTGVTGVDSWLKVYNMWGE